MHEFSQVLATRSQLAEAIRASDTIRIEKLLLTDYVNLKYVDDDGLTPLHRACSIGNLAVCRLLVAHGASQALTDRHGWHPVHVAAYHGHSHVVRFLLDDANVASHSAIAVYDEDTRGPTSSKWAYRNVARWLDASVSGGSSSCADSSGSIGDWDESCGEVEVEDDVEGCLGDVIERLAPGMLVEHLIVDVCELRHLELSDDDFVF